MENYTKRLLSLALAVVMIFSMMPDFSFAASAQTETQSQTQASAIPENIQAQIAEGVRIQTEATTRNLVEEGYCPIHGSGVTWVKKTTGMSTTAQGGEHYHFYLDGDFNYNWSFGDVSGNSTLCLWLNGKNITQKSYTGVSAGCTVNIMGNGTITNTTPGQTGNLISWGGTYNLYGGTYTSVAAASDAPKPVIHLSSGNAAALNLYPGATVDGSYDSDGDGTADVFYPAIDADKGVVNILGGTVRNGQAAGGGGNIHAASGVTLNIYDGLITNGKSTGSSKHGGNVHVSYTAFFNMYGGTIEDGESVAGSGGNVFVNSGTQMKMYGGTIKDGTALNNGGNIYTTCGADNDLLTSSGIVMTGGEIKDGSAKAGGNLYGEKSTVTISGKFSGGNATTSGGSIQINATSVMTINEGASIRGGSLVDAQGALVKYEDVYVTSGATFTNNTYVDVIDAINIAGATTDKASMTAKCRHCGESVGWFLMSDYRWPSGHKYVPVGGITKEGGDYVAGYNTFSQSSGVSLCVNLNGTGVTTTGSAFVLSNASAKLAIMGKGTVSGAGTSSKGAVVDITNGAQVDIYSGNFTQTDTVAALMRVAKGQLRIHGGNLANTASVSASQAMVHAAGGADASVTIGADAVLDAKNNYAFNCWTSTGTVTISGKVTGKIKMQSALGKLVGEPEISWLVPDSPVDATGMTGGNVVVDKSGVFTTAFGTPEAAQAAAEYFSIYNSDGSKEVFANGDKKLEIGVPPVEVIPGAETTINQNLDFGSDGTAWCPVCKRHETWTALTTEGVEVKTSGHYYVPEGGLTTTGDAFLLKTTGASDVICLHLNGQTLSGGDGKSTVWASGTADGQLNIIGGNGGTIAGQRKYGWGGAAVHVDAPAMEVVLHSGTYTKMATDTVAPILFIATNGGTITMKENVVVGNETPVTFNGVGIVGVYGLEGKPGVFNMEGGVIYAGNNASGSNKGSGVELYTSYTTFNMTGGTIYGAQNSTDDFPIYVRGEGTVNIGANATVGANGAGKTFYSPWIGSGTVTMNVSGTVNGTWDLGNITGNSINMSISGQAKFPAGIVLKSTRVIDVSGLTEGANVYVDTSAHTNGVFTKPITTADPNVIKTYIHPTVQGKVIGVTDTNALVVEEDLPAAGTITGGLTVSGSKKGYCPVCGTYHTWTVVTDGVNISAAGYYYLNSEDITNITVSAASGKVCLHLNGHNITNTEGAAITVSGAATLNIMGTGTVSGVGTAKTTGAALHVTAGQVNLYSGNYIKSDTVAPIIYAAGGNITMAVKEGDAATGAVIGSATGLSATTAAIYLGASTFTMNNGTIYGLTASGDAGAVYLNTGANFLMNDGEILLGSCATGRALILAAYGSATIGEGAEVDATAAGFALNQWNAGSSVVTISGTITGKVNTSHANGGLKLVGAPNIGYLYVGTTTSGATKTIGLVDVNGLTSGASVKVFADTPVFTTAITGDIDVILSGLTPYKTGYEMVKEGNAIAVQIPKGQIDGKLILVDNKGWCWHCNEYVTWTTPATGTNKYQMTTATHYYLADSVTYNRIDTGWYTGIDYSKAAQYCLHLNGNNIINDAGSAIVMSRNYGAVLSIMGGGIVSGVASGSYPGYCGAAIQMTHHLGVINLYSGTYTKPVTDEEAPVIFIQDGGGTINMYEKAVIDASGRKASKLSPAIALYGGGQTLSVTGFTDDNEGYAAGANPNRPAVFNMYGGIIKTGVVTGNYGSGITLIKTYSQFNMYGGKINEEDTTKTDVVLVLEKGQADIQANAKVYGTVTQWSDAATRLSVSGTVNRVSASNKTNGIVLSGAPTIGELSLASGVLADVSGLTGGNIAVTASGAFTAPLEPAKAEQLKTAFKAYSKIYKVDVTAGNELILVITVTYTTPLDGNWSDEAAHKAYCAVCKGEKTWTEWTGGAISEDGHYYLSDTVTAATTIADGVKVCLHLNDNNITVEDGAAVSATTGELNVLGSGTVTGYSEANSTGAAVNITTGTANLYSGIYTKTDSVAPVIRAGSGRLNLIGATVNDCEEQNTAYGLVYVTTGTIDVRAGATINAAVRAINCWSSANLISISGTVHGEILAQAQGLVLSGKPIIDELNVRQYGPNADNLSDIMVDVNGLTGGQIGLVIKEHKIRVFTTEITGGNAATIAGYFTYVGETTDKLIIVAEGNYLTLAKAAFEVIDSNGQTVNITNLSQAIEHTAENEGSYVKIIEDSTISISLEEGKSAAIDVNGKEVTINGTGTIYGFDNSTDNYGDSEYGFLTVGEDVEVALDNTVDGKRYLAIEHGEDTNTYSFHRVEIKLTQIVLNVDKAALYYKAEFRSDDTLASRVESYGINFDLAGMPNSQDPDTLGIPFGEGEGCFNGTGKATSGYIYGIVTEDDPDNAANMGKPIYANPYLEVDVTGEDTVVGFDQYDTNTEVRKSLKDILNYYETNTDNSYSRLTEERKQVLAEFCVKMGLTEFTTLCAAVPAPAVPAPANEEEEEEA